MEFSGDCHGEWQTVHAFTDQPSAWYCFGSWHGCSGAACSQFSLGRTWLCGSAFGTSMHAACISPSGSTQAA